MSKKFWDPSAFTDTKSALALIKNAIRQTLEYDALGGPEFIARVISTPQLISVPAAAALNAPTAGTDANVWGPGLDALEEIAAGDGVDAASAQRALSLNNMTDHFSYMARIDKIHGAFLPDPCSPSIAKRPRMAQMLVSQHTEIISSGTTLRPPTVGDFVRVRLEKGDNGGWNIQHGAHIEIWQEMNAIDGIGVGGGCGSLSDLFGDEVVPYVGDGLPGDLGAWDSTDGYVQVTPTERGGIVSTEAITNFLTKLRLTIPAEDVATLVVTSGYRDAARQASALHTKRNENNCQAALTSIPASGSPCRPIYDLYKDTTLIMEVLKVANSVSLMQAVYQAQIDRGEFSSGHMSGLGIDLRSSNLTVAQRDYVIKKAKELGGSAIYEPDPPHIHIGIPSSFGAGASGVIGATAANDVPGAELATSSVSGVAFDPS